MQSASSFAWRALKGLGGLCVALVIVFEEWGWVPLARAMGRLARLPGISWIERRIVALPARVALGVLFLPMLLLLPVKVGALWLMAGGRVAAGIAVFLAAKLASTGVVARLFLLTQPKLMQLAWFARVYRRWLAWKDALLARARATLPWRLARAALRRLRRATRRR